MGIRTLMRDISNTVSYQLSPVLRSVNTFWEQIIIYNGLCMLHTTNINPNSTAGNAILTTRSSIVVISVPVILRHPLWHDITSAGNGIRSIRHFSGIRITFRLRIYVSVSLITQAMLSRLGPWPVCRQSILDGVHPGHCLAVYPGTSAVHLITRQ